MAEGYRDAGGCLGLSGHQRAVVLHTKKDRQHAHVVWNRVDTETLKAAQHSHNYRTHETVSRALEKEFGLDHVQGVHVDPQPERPPRGEKTTESQQAARTGWTTKQAKADITAAWEQSANGAEFREALADLGYSLARGDRKAVVILDPAGGVHGITRRLDGVRAAQVREKLSDLDLRTLPSLQEVRARLEREGVVPAQGALQREDGAQPSRPRPAVERPAAPRPPARYAAIQPVRVEFRQSWSKPSALVPRPTPPSWARHAPAASPNIACSEPDAPITGDGA